jgi:hypothetical protein
MRRNGMLVLASVALVACATGAGDRRGPFDALSPRSSDSRLAGGAFFAAGDPSDLPCLLAEALRGS